MTHTRKYAAWSLRRLIVNVFEQNNVSPLQLILDNSHKTKNTTLALLKFTIDLLKMNNEFAYYHIVDTLEKLFRAVIHNAFIRSAGVRMCARNIGWLYLSLSHSVMKDKLQFARYFLSHYSNNEYMQKNCGISFLEAWWCIITAVLCWHSIT